MSAGFVSDEGLRVWAQAHAWAVTTEHECWGWERPEPGEPVRFALYDSDEDDPPIAVFDFREDAERVAAVLTRYGA